MPHFLGSAAVIKPRNAFSLIELTTVVLIVAILTAVAAPKFVGAYHHQRVEAAAARIQADLNLARQTAIARSKAQAVVFDSSANNYTLAGLNDLNRRSDTYSVDLSASPYEVALAADSVGSDGTLTFNIYGVPNAGGTLTVSDGRYAQTVTIDAVTGKAAIP